MRMISIIISTFDEARELPATLTAVQAQQALHEIIVVDARSTDGTPAIAGSSGASLISSEHKQRAAQMNLGAHAARGDILLFLHADTRLAEGALMRIENALQCAEIIGGGFARHYANASPFLRVTCALAELRTRAFGWFLGDQAIFVRRATFEMLCGFREWETFEDLDFSRRMARAGRVVTLRPAVISAARRFAARGAVKTTLSDLWLTMRYLAGRIPKATEASPRGVHPLAPVQP
jgi:rSAM/selenodomain-associated transferase 2